MTIGRWQIFLGLGWCLWAHGYWPYRWKDWIFEYWLTPVVEIRRFKRSFHKDVSEVRKFSKALRSTLPKPTTPSPFRDPYTGKRIGRIEPPEPPSKDSDPSVRFP